MAADGFKYTVRQLECFSITVEIRRIAVGPQANVEGTAERPENAEWPLQESSAAPSRLVTPLRWIAMSVAAPRCRS